MLDKGDSNRFNDNLIRDTQLVTARPVRVDNTQVLDQCLTGQPEGPVDIGSIVSYDRRLELIRCEGRVKNGM